MKRDPSAAWPDVPQERDDKILPAPSLRMTDKYKALRAGEGGAAGIASGGAKLFLDA
jgi:hypothetical protein